MDDKSEGRELPDAAKTRRKFRYTDAVAVTIIIAIIIGFTGLLLSKASLRRDIASSQTITDKVIVDISKRDGAAARKLGNAEFKKLYSDKTLTQQFQAISEATVGDPTIEQQNLVTRDSKKMVFAVYKYPPRLANKSFYIGVIVSQSGDTWQVVNISGSADASKLFN